MGKIKKLILLVLVSSVAVMMVACSEEDEQKKSKNEATGDHIWKHQTDALKTSKDVAKKLQESMNQQQQKLDESN